MTNQMILWSSIILPWITLFFMKKEEIKRYMPVALFGALITTIVAEIALALNWWAVKDSIFPFYHMAPFTYGAFIVGTIWIFKLTYKRFLLFMLTNAAFDFVLSFPIMDFIAQRGILDIINITSFQLLVINLLTAAVLYGYQLWQEDVLVTSERTISPAILQPATAKPMSEENNNKED